MNKKIIALLMCVLMLSAIVAGCAAKGSKTPNEAINGLFDGIKAVDVKKSGQYVTDPKKVDEGLILKETKVKSIVQKMFANLQYTTSDVKVDGNKAIANVKITMPDMSDLLNNAFMSSVVELQTPQNASLKEEQKQQILQDAILKSISDNIDAKKYKLIETTKQVNLEKKGSWLVNLDSGLLNQLMSMSGNNLGEQKQIAPANPAPTATAKK